MSTEDEFTRWLRRPEKTYLENLEFALKAWQSAEFTLPSKYELVLSWVAAEGATTEEDFPAQSYATLLQLRAHPGLVALQTKHEFVEMLLQCAAKLTQDETRTLPDLLRRLNEFELLQDLYRSDYELQARAYAAQLRAYDTYLRQLKATSFLSAHESEFMAALLTALRDSAKRATNIAEFERSYSAHVLQPLAEVLLLLRTHSLCFFDELLALERQFSDAFPTEEGVFTRILRLPLHVRLLALECAIVSRRGMEHFMVLLLQQVFGKMSEELPQEQIKGEQDAALSLTVAAYTLEMLRKHDISLNFKIGKQSALEFLGARLVDRVEKHKNTQLREVLMLLGATLRLNPLILEQHVFQVTTWMIVSTKPGAAEQQLFAEYLVLLMDMFRRLSRADKFVVNLLKAIREWLSSNQVCAKEKGKRKTIASKETPNKKKKLEVGAESAIETSAAAVLPSNAFYLQILFADFYKTPEVFKNETTTADNSNSFIQLEAVWPSASVGVAFSKLITGLVSKPSMAIWKTLLYALKELLESLQLKTEDLNENALFHLDLHAALLCQYFAGAKLAEQSDRYATEIAAQRRFTAEVLGAFGRFLLAREHEPRTMRAFLECGFHVASFELLLAYYRPDGEDSEAVAANDATIVAQLHDFLSEQEWTLLQQRVLNFGNASCKFLLNRLLLQRAQAQQLLLQVSPPQQLSLHKALLSPIGSDHEQLDLLLSSSAANGRWLIGQLPRAEKLEVAKELLSNSENNSVVLSPLADDLEALELAALAVFERLCVAFAAGSKDFLLADLNCDFEKLLGRLENSSDYNKHLPLLVAVINNRAAGLEAQHFSKKKLPQRAAEQALQTLRQLPIGHLRRACKSLLFALLLAFYCDLKATQEEDLAAEAFEMLTDMLHFGQQVQIFKYFPTESILKLLPVANCWEFYEFIFSTIKNEEKGTDLFLLSLTEIIKNAQGATGKLSDDQRRLTLIGIETLAGISGPGGKRMRKHLNALLEIYANHVNAHFGQAKTTSDSSDGASKKDKKFVEKTLAGMAPYASALLVKAAAPEVGEDASPASVDENFRRICKIYIGHSMDYRNPHAIRLLQVALNHRLALHLDQDEIEFVLSGYWRQLNEDLKSQQQPTEVNTTEPVVKMIIGNKTNEDLLLTMKDIAAHALSVQDFTNVTRLLALIAKCPFSTIKGAIFNEQFKQITCDITLRLARDEQQQFINYGHVTSILTCQQSIAENKMIPISSDTLDTILAFLMDINIKRFQLTDTNTACFRALHLAMSDLCLALIKQRHVLLMDRVPQFMHIFKDLLQSVVCYKNERQKDTTLSPTELDDLVELAQKLEALMHVIATHSVGVKRVAPFILTFVINLMVANKRPTTLYPKIKTHIENVCYDLVGICDHRVGRFILRCSNEAARQVYEALVKDHKKYHKFKGKV